MIRRLAGLGVALALLGGQPAAAQGGLRPEHEAFIARMQQEHGIDPAPLRVLLRTHKPNAGILRAISAPGIARPWYQVRQVLVDPARVLAGVRFWSDNAAALARARETYGVPEEVLAAVIGVETRYGRTLGGFRAFDALATLAFDYPPRAAFFREQLVQLLLLARELNRDPARMPASYAGALGLPQFMPDSYRRLAVDFNGDGSIDLWSDPADAIGSVAAYLRSAGWQVGLPVVVPARIDAPDAATLLETGLTTAQRLDEWAARGVQALSPAEPALEAVLFGVDLLGGAEHWFGTANFRALFQYNHSRNYVMAVNDLARELVRERERQALVPAVLP